MQAAISVHEANSWFGTSLETIQDALREANLSAVHLGAVLQCLYAGQRTSYTKNLNSLPEKIRHLVCYQPQARIVREQKSSDGTVKWLLQFDDGCCIETVLIPEAKRSTLCISSQVGCAFGCHFCATGTLGLQRNLSCREIVEQLYIANNFLQASGGRISNVVFMGMGEPLHNLDAVVDACRLFCHDQAFGLSRYKVTISTVGLVPAIYQLVGRTNVSLALSLHASDDAKRRELLPIARKYSIAQTLEAVSSYLQSLEAGRQVFIEYTLIAGSNDSPQQAVQLALLLQDFSCKINLIPCNPRARGSMIVSDSLRIGRFVQILRSYNHLVTIRQTRGQDIDAACGQLAFANKQG